MKVLFIGGTGRLSKDVAEMALDKGYEVYLFTRGNNERKKFVLPEYKMIYGNIRNVEESKKLLSQYNFDVVIDFLTFDIEQLDNILNIIDGKYKQYIFISSATVYKKKNDDEIIKEDTTETGNDRWQYAYNKFLCEEYLKTYFKNRGGVYTIIRPYVTYGNTRVPYPIVPSTVTEEWTLIDRILKKRPVPVFDGGKTVTTLTHTRDFAKAVVGLFCNESAYGEAFHIASDKTVTWGQVLDELENKLGIRIIRADMTQEEIYTSMPIYKGILVGDKGTTMRFNNEKIRAAVVEFECNVSLTEGISDMIDFYNANPDMKKINYYWNGCVDKMCKRFKNGQAKKYNFPNRKALIEYYSGRYKMFKYAVSMIGKIKK